MTPTEVQYLLSAPNADQGYTSPGSVYNSNGMYCSTTQVNSEVSLDNLFPDVTGPQNAAGQVDYQCVFVYNSDTTDAMTNCMAWIPVSSLTSGALEWAIAADPTGVSNYNVTSQQAVEIASPYVAPSGVTSWSAPSSTVSGGIALGTINARQVYPLWIRRTATGVSAAPAGFDLYVTFDV
jgi:hypothetical protein